jgi:hypothetical protein
MEQAELERMVHEVLGTGYKDYVVSQYQLVEDMRENCARLECVLLDTHSGETSNISGLGVGLVDALFKGLKDSLSTDYPSLDRIHFVDFTVAGDFRTSSSENGSDALGHVRLVVENSSGREFVFEAESHSVSASSCDVVVMCVEHFVNAELAVLRILEWIREAKERHRPDLVEQYTRRLSDLMQNATYSKSIERMRVRTLS